MKFVDIAKEVAQNKSTQHVFKHSALLIKGKEIVGIGYNTQLIHAEPKAILDAIWRVLWN